VIETRAEWNAELKATEIEIVVALQVQTALKNICRDCAAADSKAC